MLRFIIAFLALVLAAASSAACTICDGAFRTRPTLRLQFASAKAVLYGELKNPRFDPKTDEGSTDLHIDSVLKDDQARGMATVLTLRTYLPVVGNTPPGYVIFCNVTNGKLDPSGGIPASAAIVDYIKAAARLDDSDANGKLSFYFKHLDSSDPTIAADAFCEFARASDSEIIKAAKQFDAAKLRKLISSSNTPPERVGVFALLLGACGNQSDAAFLAGLLNENPTSERTSSAFSGLLAGYILLSPKDGWSFTSAVLGDSKRGYSTRLSAITTVRFFQATRETDSKPEVLKCCAALLPHGDLADQAIEDLRRWGYWDLTTDVLAQYTKPSHSAPIVRRCIVRYALCCPNEEAKRFVAELRQADPKLVRELEDMLLLFAPVNPAKK